MEIEQVINLILSTVQITQSISIGLFLLFIGFKRKKNVSALGVFLIVLGLNYIFEMLHYYAYNEQSIHLSYWSSAFMFLSPTLLYHYVHSLLITPKRKLHVGIVTFGCVGFLFGSIAPFINTVSIVPDLYEIVGLLYIITIFILIFFHTYQHNKQVNEQYSNTEPRELKWVLYISAYFIIGAIALSTMPIMFDIPDLFMDIIASFFSLIWLLALAYNGLLFQSTKDLLTEYSSTAVEFVSENRQVQENKKEDSQNQNTTENLEKIQEQDAATEILFEKIKNKIEDEDLFLNSDLTITDLALHLKEHPKTVSKTINSQANQNFNAFINHFRVLQAKKLLSNSENKNISIDGIGKLSGFRSNSAFYSAFKKELNITPLQFQKNTNFD